MVAAALYCFISNRPNKLKVLFIPIALGIFLLLNTFLFGDRAIALDPTSLSGRGPFWLAILSVLSVSPFVGLRPGGWIKYLESGIMFWGTPLKVQSAHSMYLEIAINWGIPLLLMILLLLITTFLKNHKIIISTFGNKSLLFERNWLIALNASMAAFLIGGLAENIPIFLIFFLIATSSAIREKLRTDNHK